VPLGDLAAHDDVRALLGGAEAVAVLTGQPLELVFLAAIRAAKTVIACAAALRMTQTVDTSGLGPGETPRVSLISLKIDTARTAFNIFRGAIEASSELRSLLIDEPTQDALSIRHPSGRPIEVKVTHGAKAGGGLVSVWSAGVIFDEAPRMNGADDAVVNLDDARKAVHGRLLPGAQALYIGSPWAPHGPVYDMVKEGWGNPTRTRVVLRGTGPMLNPVWWTPERCDALRNDNPGAYQTDVLGEFADPDGGLIAIDALKRSTRTLQGDLPYELRGQYTAAIDPSEGGANGNPWTLVIVKREERMKPASKPDGTPLFNNDATRTMRPHKFYRVALVREWRGARPGQVLEEVARACRGYGLSKAVTDQYAGAANADLAAQHGLTLEIIPWTAPRKVQAFTDMATHIESGDIELHADPQLQRDLASVRKRTTQQGVAIVLPQMGDGRHCDYAPALASAIENAGASEWSSKTFSVRGL